MKKKLFATALVASMMAAMPLMSSAATTFTDVSEFSPYAPYINDLQSKGVVIGKTSDTFGPNDQLTRAQMAVMLVKAFNLPISSKPTKFYDSQSHWGKMYIESAFEAGVVSGTSTTTFEPDKSLTREQAATMVWNYLKAHGVSETTSNITVQGDHSTWSTDALKNIMGYKLYQLQEVANDDYDAKSTMTREQAAALIDLALKQVQPQQSSGGSNDPVLNQTSNSNNLYTNADGTLSAGNLKVDTELGKAQNFTDAQLQQFQKYLSEVKFTTTGQNVTVTIPDVGNSDIYWGISSGVHSYWQGTGGNTVTLTNVPTCAVDFSSANTGANYGRFVLKYVNNAWEVTYPSWNF